MLLFIGRVLCPYVLFTHFFDHLFAPIMGRFDEPNMGLPILETVLRELLFLGYIILQMSQRKKWDLERMKAAINTLNPELNPICYLLALLAHHFLHVSRIRVKSLTLRLLMSYIYGAPILDVSRSHATTQHSR